MREKIEYQASGTVAQRSPIYIDLEKDPRAKNQAYLNLYASRSGAQIIPVDSLNGSLTSAQVFHEASSNAAGSGSLDATQSQGTDIATTAQVNVTYDQISNLSASWSGSELNITWDFDTTLGQNSYATNFLIQFVVGGTTYSVKSYAVNKSAANQSYTLTRLANISLFGTAKTSITTISVAAEDNYGNIGSSASISGPTYSNSFTAPTMILSSISTGYSVNITNTGSQPATLYVISIEEYVSDSLTEPTGVTYTQVSSTIINPANIIRSSYSKRWVKARFVDEIGSYGPYCAAQAVTPTSPVTADVTGPDNVASVTTSGGIDTTGYLGFNAYADISWQAVTGGGIRGYRIRFSNDNGTTYSYVDSPGTGTTYRLGGLAVGSTYKIAVATYDEYNNTSTQYVAGADVTVTGTPSVSNYITAGNFQFGYGVGSVSTNKGLYFDSSNYWYINASNSARLKVGGTSSNYLLWDGTNFTVDGNITARGGSFSGNVALTTSGASIYNGDVTTTPGSLTGDGFIFNKDGIVIKKGSNAITLDVTLGTITANSVNLTGKISAIKTSVSDTTNGGYYLDSTGAAIVGDSTAYFQYDKTNHTINLTTSYIRTSGGEAAYNGASQISLGANGTQIYGIPIQGDQSSVSGGGSANIINYTYAHYQNASSLGAYPRQRTLVEDPVTGLVKVGLGVYYGTGITPSSGGYIGDLWVVY